MRVYLLLLATFAAATHLVNHKTRIENTSALVTTSVPDLVACLYCYGFFVTSASDGKWVYPPDSFLITHFDILYSENLSPTRVKMSKEDLRDKSPSPKSLKQAAEALNDAAMIAAMALSLHQWEVAAMMSLLLSETNIREKKLLIVAASMLQIDWFVAEVLKYKDTQNIERGIYMLIRRYLNGADNLYDTIRDIIAGMPYELIHNDIKRLVLDTKDTVECAKTMDTLQTMFRVVNKDSLRYFMGPELIFALIHVFKKRSVRWAFENYEWKGTEIKFLVRMGFTGITQETSFRDLKKALLKLLHANEYRVNLIPIIHGFMRDDRDTKGERNDVWKLIDRTPIRDFLDVFNYNDSEKRVCPIVEKHPEYAYDETLFIWLVKIDRLDIVSGMCRVRNDKVSGCVLLEEDVTQIISRKVGEKGLRDFTRTGVVLQIGNRNITIIEPEGMSNLLEFGVVRVPRYNLELVRLISEKKQWRLFDQLMAGVKNKSIVREYVNSLQKTTIATTESPARRAH